MISSTDRIPLFPEAPIGRSIDTTIKGNSGKKFIAKKKKTFHQIHDIEREKIIDSFSIVGGRQCF